MAPQSLGCVAECLVHSGFLQPCIPATSATSGALAPCGWLGWKLTPQIGQFKSLGAGHHATRLCPT